MKKIMTAVVALCLTMAVAAQHAHGIVRSRVVVVSSGIGFGYSPFYSPFGYSPFGYPYGYANGYRVNSKLDRKIEDIRTDYADKIKSAKHDTSISKAERKKIVKDLKADREKDIHDLKANYYKPRKPAADPGNNG
jgi:hypothetical protein